MAGVFGTRFVIVTVSVNVAARSTGFQIVAIPPQTHVVGAWIVVGAVIINFATRLGRSSVTAQPLFTLVDGTHETVTAISVASTTAFCDWLVDTVEIVAKIHCTRRAVITIQILQAASQLRTNAKSARVGFARFNCTNVFVITLLRCITAKGIGDRGYLAIPVYAQIICAGVLIITVTIFATGLLHFVHACILDT